MAAAHFPEFVIGVSIASFVISFAVCYAVARLNS